MCLVLFILVEDFPIQVFPSFNLLVEQNLWTKYSMLTLVLYILLEFLSFRIFQMKLWFKTIPSSSSGHGAPTVSVLGTFPLPINYRTPESLKIRLKTAIG